MSKLGTLIQQRDIFVMNGNDEQADRIQNLIDNQVRTKTYSLDGEKKEKVTNGETLETIIGENKFSGRTGIRTLKEI